MDNTQMKRTKQQAIQTTTDSPKNEPEPFFEWRYKINEKTGESEFDALQLSDGSSLTPTNFQEVVKRTTGASDLAIGERIIKKIARGMSAEKQDARLNEVSALLPALGPKNETEALLLGQFLALQDSGMKCLRLANLPEQNFYHTERLCMLANKLLNTANQTMLAVTKFRSGGQQTIQVMHVHNEGQAIVAQNVSHTHQGTKE